MTRATDRMLNRNRSGLEWVGQDIYATADRSMRVCNSPSHGRNVSSSIYEDVVYGLLPEWSTLGSLGWALSEPCRP